MIGLVELYFSRFILLAFSPSLLIYGGSGVGGCGFGVGSWIKLSGLGFSLDGFGVCGIGPSDFFGVGALYINIDE
mgnify:CR=1 FL=1